MKVTKKVIINMKMNINHHILWEELLRKILLGQDSISKLSMEDIGTLYQHKEVLSNSLIKCKLVAMPFSYNKFKMIVIWVTRDNQSMIRNSQTQEKRLKGKYFVCLQKSKSKLLSNIKMSKNKLKP